MTEKKKRPKIRRLRLRRNDGKVYLNRWGFGFKHFLTGMIHVMDESDPGIDLHDHPWWFVTIPLYGGYEELRADCREAPELARKGIYGKREVRRPFRPRVMRLDECHTITKLNKKRSVSLVISGPVKRTWGFYPEDGYVQHKEYEKSDRGLRRELFCDVNEERAS